MSTIQERRHTNALQERSRAEQQRDAAIAKLVRASGKIKTLTRSIERYEKAIAEQKEREREARRIKLANKAANK